MRSPESRPTSLCSLTSEQALPFSSLRDLSVALKPPQLRVVEHGRHPPYQGASSLEIACAIADPVDNALHRLGRDGRARLGRAVNEGAPLTTV